MGYRQRYIDETGNRHGRLTVLRRAGTVDRKAMWECLCDCGNRSVVRGTELRSGATRSCGYYLREVTGERGKLLAPVIGKANERHGHSGSGGTRRPNPTWKAWRSMRERCQNPNNPSYSRYGGRGISVCERWETYENFLADVGERPADPPGWSSRVGYWSLDRVDPDGNYEPGNVRWADPVTQRHNRSRS